MGVPGRLAGGGSLRVQRGQGWYDLDGRILRAAKRGASAPGQGTASTAFVAYAPTIPARRTNPSFRTGTCMT